MARRDGTSDCRMGCKATYRGLWLGAGARMPGSGSRLCLRRNLYPAASGHGHSGPANCATLTLAKWACGTADWVATARMPRLCRRLRRAAPAPGAPYVPGLLQQREDTPVLEQGCAGTTGYSDRWAHLRKPNSRRITPSVCLDLIYDRDKSKFAGSQSI